MTGKLLADAASKVVGAAVRNTPKGVDMLKSAVSSGSQTIQKREMSTTLPKSALYTESNAAATQRNPVKSGAGSSRPFATDVISWDVKGRPGHVATYVTPNGSDPGKPLAFDNPEGIYTSHSKGDYISGEHKTYRDPKELNLDTGGHPVPISAHRGLNTSFEQDVETWGQPTTVHRFNDNNHVQQDNVIGEYEDAIDSGDKKYLLADYEKGDHTNDNCMTQASKIIEAGHPEVFSAQGENPRQERSVSTFTKIMDKAADEVYKRPFDKPE